MPVWWYVTRASGLVAWGLLTLTIVWGLLLSTKLLGRKPTPAWILDLHRFVGAAAVVFTFVHVLGILADSYVHFDLADVLVPFASSWHPLAVAWGVVAMYLLLAVEITSLLRKRIPAKLWRRTHYASFPLFLVATMHGVSAGSDATTTIAVLLGIVSIGVVGLLGAARLERRRGRAGSASRAARPAVPGPARPSPPVVSSTAAAPPAPPRRGTGAAPRMDSQPVGS